MDYNNTYIDINFEPSTSVFIVFVVRCICSIIATIENIALIVVYFLYVDSRHFSTFIVTNLAIADTLIVRFIIFSILVSTSRVTTTIVITTVIALKCMQIYTYSNVIFMSLIALDRLIFIVYPLQYYNIITT